MEFKVTNSFSRDKLNYETGTVKNIHYGDIHTKFQTLFDIGNEVVPFVNEEENVGRILGENYCEEGDMIFADASEDLNDVGKSIEIVNVNGEKLLSGLHTLLARPQKGIFYLGFNGYLFKSSTIRAQIMKEAQGSKVLSISAGRISKIDLPFPSLKEQQKISTLFSDLDRRIQTQNKIIEELKLLKNLVIKKSINRELRFSEFTDDWNTMTLGEVCEKQASNISANKIEDNFGDYTIYGASGELKKVDFYEVENDYIGIVKDGAGAGRLFYCEGRSSVLGTLDIIKPSKNVDTYFLYCLLSCIDFSKYSSGSTIPHIYFKDYANERIEVPATGEQIKIANFLSTIDQKIQTEKAIEERFETQKKDLLLQLFV